MEAWLKGAQLPGLPAGENGVRNFLAYLQDLVDSGCARTVPESCRKALHFLEGAGNQHPHLRVGDHPLVLDAIKDYQVQATSCKGLQPRQAPHFFVKIAVALEFVVVDLSVEPYVRVVAWARLVRLWAGLRFGDTEHLHPDDVSLKGDCLALALRRTKTTGAGKKVAMMWAFIGRASAWLARPDWLAVGYNLWFDLGRHLDRDYVLPHPDRDLKGFVPRPLVFADSLRLGRTLLVHLKDVQYVQEERKEAVWIERAGKLLEPDAALFWTEHSTRAAPLLGRRLGVHRRRARLPGPVVSAGQRLLRADQPGSGLALARGDRREGQEGRGRRGLPRGMPPCGQAGTTPRGAGLACGQGSGLQHPAVRL